MGYIDCASIGLAILITMIATGIQGAQAPGGLAASTWSAWPREDLKFSEAFIAVNSIVFAYAFASAQPSFMQEMHTPKDYIKSTWSVMVIQIFVYTLTGAIIYAFVGQEVQSPALLSAGPVVSRIVFGIALPVIFISGSINTTIVCRYIHGKIYEDSVVRYVNTKKGWITWLGLVTIITFVAWIIAEAIPIFSELLSISASLFVSGLSFYFPPVMWFLLLKEGKWYAKENIRSAIYNGIVFLFGVIVLVAGTYATVAELVSFEVIKCRYLTLTCSSDHHIQVRFRREAILMLSISLHVGGSITNYRWDLLFHFLNTLCITEILTRGGFGKDPCVN